MSKPTHPTIRTDQEAGADLAGEIVALALARVRDLFAHRDIAPETVMLATANALYEAAKLFEEIPEAAESCTYNELRTAMTSHWSDVIRVGRTMASELYILADEHDEDLADVFETAPPSAGQA